MAETSHIQGTKEPMRTEPNPNLESRTWANIEQETDGERMAGKNATKQSEKEYWNTNKNEDKQGMH